MPPKRIILKSSSGSSIEQIQRPTRNTRPKRTTTRDNTPSSSPKKRMSTRSRSPKKSINTTITADESDLVVSGAEDDEDDDDEDDEELELSSGAEDEEEEDDDKDEDDEEDDDNDNDNEEEDDKEILGDDEEEESIRVSEAPSSDNDLSSKDSSSSLEELADSSDMESISASISSTALASGKLTARQRAIIQAEEMLLDSSPSLEVFATPKTLTEEEFLKKSEKSRRRKTQRDQKLEQSKAETIQRLLQKQGTRSKKLRAQNFEQESENETVGKIDGLNKPVTGFGMRLVDNKNETLLILGPKVPNICRTAVAVKNAKKLACAFCSDSINYQTKNGINVCSLACYNKAQ